MNALQEMIDPEAAKAGEVIEQMKDGNYQKKKRKEGESDDLNEERKCKQDGDDKQDSGSIMPIL